MPSEIYISIDIEANGPIPGEFSMTALGACVVGRPEESYHAELRPLHDRFEPRALAVGGLTMEHLREKGEDPAEALRRFSAWVKSAAGGHRPVFVAFNFLRMPSTGGPPLSTVDSVKTQTGTPGGRSRRSASPCGSPDRRWPRWRGP